MVMVYHEILNILVLSSLTEVGGPHPLERLEYVTLRRPIPLKKRVYRLNVSHTTEGELR